MHGHDCALLMQPKHVRSSSNGLFLYFLSFSFFLGARELSVVEWCRSHYRVCLLFLDFSAITRVCLVEPAAWSNHIFIWFLFFIKERGNYWVYHWSTSSCAVQPLSFISITSYWMHAECPGVRFRHACAYFLCISGHQTSSSLRRTKMSVPTPNALHVPLLISVCQVYQMNSAGMSDAH